MGFYGTLRLKRYLWDFKRYLRDSVRYLWDFMGL